MTQRQINALHMYNAVLAYLDENIVIYMGIAPIVEQKTALAYTIDLIKTNSQNQQEKSPEGFTAAKNNAIETMINKAYKIALKVKSYAKKTGNAVLLKSVDFSMHDLESGSETEIINRCKIIANAADANIANLTNYKVVAQDVADLNTAITGAMPKAAQRDVVGSERHSITLNLPSLFSQAREQALDLDDLIEGLIDEESQEFIDGYFSVRRINDRRGGRSEKQEPQQPVSNP